MTPLERLRSAMATLGPLAKPLQPHLVEIERDFKARSRKLQALEQVSRVTAAIAEVDDQRDVDDVLERILDASLELSGAERGMIVLVSDETEVGFSVRAQRRLNEEAAVAIESVAGEAADDGSEDGDDGDASGDAQISRTLIRQILERGEGVVTTNVQDDERFIAGASMLALDIRSVMAVPIRLGEQVIGGVYVDTRFTDQVFDEGDLDAFAAFADNAAIALNLASSMRERRDLYLQSVLALANAVEAADAYTAGHSSRVGYYARGVARQLGMDEEEIERITIAGYLHDVGKIALSSNVKAPRRLTDEEFAEMKMHPVHGERILRDAPALAAILPAVRSHHERWDGRGYPDGLSGDQIHPFARILAVGDSFDAMTTDRPYRKAFELDHALREIEDNIEKMYWRDAAAAFLASFHAGELELAAQTQADAELYAGFRGIG